MAQLALDDGVAGANDQRVESLPRGRATAARLAVVLVVALTVVACGDSDKLLFVNASAESVIVQPDQPVRDHIAWILAPSEPFPDDAYVAPGSVVRIFSEQCEPITEFTFEEHSGLGETVYTLDSTGTITTSIQYNVMGDLGPGAIDHSPCRLP